MNRERREEWRLEEDNGELEKLENNIAYQMKLNINGSSMWE